jgi:hypothetical protein
MSFWPPCALAVVWLGVSSACLAAEPRAASQLPAIAPGTVDSERHLTLALPLGALGSGASASSGEADRAAALLDQAEGPAGEFPMHYLLDVHFGRADQPGRIPGDAPPLYGEVGINVDTPAGLSLVPSYRVIVNEDDYRADSRAIAGQVLKLDARIHF